MEHMFKEYSNWRGKLEQIEGKMKADVEFWKTSCEKLQKENEKMQKENLKQATIISDKNREIASKENAIDRLKKEAQLYTVEEQLCSNCKNSLEESQLFTSRSTHRHFSSQEDNQQTALLVKDLSDKLTDLEQQLLTYRERVAYHESMEDELKKNIESQVDVVLRMEEERLKMLKENKEFRERNRVLEGDNDEYRSKIELFERELEELQQQIKEETLARQQA